ncbi:EF-hand superfamily Ca2+-modulated protein [Westerdykella ornata]|uniref:EF-hand superfamily Ca2+-modulated protein n=1 Tax=Westerdykella ornata TaxID=318751 RepID=A0A6A6JTT2_WESOR|nr:EF-hand superfamily Ca2+-modulated protein [Westerdykella ornata]KAF2279982.1 EF-hand superfamily Ca2+-modulated protein [Westerdykella ornata]
MPPKRRAPSSSAKTPLRPAKPSKLAREHGLTAAQESSIREAFALFAVQHPDHADGREGVLRRDDVRRCLIALDLPPQRSELASILSTIDPLNTGYVPFIPFLSYAAIAMHAKESDSEGDYDDDEGDDKVHDEDYHNHAGVEELHAAYKLFTHGTPGPITLAHLRRVAKELREEVSDEVLKDMIREANGSAKGASHIGGVSLEEFEGVMRRAGMTF